MLLNEYIQIDAEREPLLANDGHKVTAAPNNDPKHPMDYFVPNFGIDHDIAATQGHEIAASEKLEHEWNPAWDAKAEKFIVPHVDAEFKL